MASEKLFRDGLKFQNDVFVLKVSRDRLGVVVVPQKTETPVSLVRDELARVMIEEGIVFGVLAEVEPRPDGSFWVARGSIQRHGDDSRIKMYIKPSVIRVPKVMDKERDQVDFRELGNIVNVEKDRLLLEIIPPTPGIPGQDVFGAEIPAKPGKERKIKCGPGVLLSDDGRKVFAARAGKFVMADGKPSVYEEHVIKGDVDMSLGNIAFGGRHLIIQGGVPSGFSIKCRGDITIGKGVHNSLVMAGGNLKVGGSVLGEDSVLRAKGDVEIAFMENGPFVEAGGHLTVFTSSIQCQALVGGNFYLKGKGTVVGGKYFVGGSVYVRDLGTDAEVQTVLHVGVNPAIQKRKQQLDKDLNLWAERLNKAIKNISALEKIKRERGRQLPQEKAELLDKYKILMPKAMARMHSLTEDNNALEQELKQMTAEMVCVAGILYPGGLISIGNATRYITSQDQQCVVYFDQATQRILIRKMGAEELASFS